MATSPRPSVSQRDLFTRVSAWTIRITGGRWAFLAAFGTVVIWGLSGPYFHFSENWQLVINTGTTIVTFLMVFLIQGAQNRESKAIHLKLDELIFSVRKARNELIDIENLNEAELDKLGDRYRKVAEAYQHKLLGHLQTPDDRQAVQALDDELHAAEASHMTVK